MNAVVALAIMAVAVFGTIAFALTAVRRFRMDAQEFIVGSRSFGPLLLWILLAGEIYTTFTFLGAAGWAYGKGAPSFYIIAYLPLSYLIGYFYMPKVWRIGKARGHMTWPDFLGERYGSKAFGAGVALLQFALMVPYVTLQLTGLQIILTIAGYGSFEAEVAAALAFALIAIFVFTAGIRGAAWASVIKDAVLLMAAIFAGIGLPMYFFGSPANMIAHVLQQKPHWLTLSMSGRYGMAWFISTVALTCLGGMMFPATAQATFSAKDEETVRRNMMFMPLYNVVIVLMLLAGFTAVLVVPGLKGTQADQSFLLMLQLHFPAWALGLVGAAGCLAALIPASVLLLSAASVVSRNVLGNTRWCRPMVLICALLALVLWFFAKTTLVDLLLLVYNGISQLFPAVILGLFWKRMNVYAAAAGIVTGEAIAIYTLHATSGPWGINLGLIALAVNALVCVAVALLSPMREREAAYSVTTT